MGTLEQLEWAVKQLEPNDLDQFIHWFEQYRATRGQTDWDDQIRQDAESGKLAEHMAKARELHTLGRTQKL